MGKHKRLVNEYIVRVYSDGSAEIVPYVRDWEADKERTRGLSVRTSILMDYVEFIDRERESIIKGLRDTTSSYGDLAKSSRAKAAFDKLIIAKTKELAMKYNVTTGTITTKLREVRYYDPESDLIVQGLVTGQFYDLLYRYLLKIDRDILELILTTVVNGNSKYDVDYIRNYMSRH